MGEEERGQARRRRKEGAESPRNDGRGRRPATAVGEKEKAIDRAAAAGDKEGVDWCERGLRADKWCGCSALMWVWRPGVGTKRGMLERRRGG